MKRTFLRLFLFIGTIMVFQRTFAQEEITIHDRQLGQDEVFTLPEGLTISDDQLLSEWQAKNYLYSDTACENPNYNPTYGVEVYRERLYRLPTVIEMSYNEVVQGFIDRYTNRQRRTVAAMIGASNLYVPLFEEALDYYGLPLELKYLPIIESALNPRAVSPVGATGLWQLMLATGKQYNLNVNSRVDERMDPIKSTWAAVRYLRDLFKIYGDWQLVLAAYNCGPGNVNKAIRRADGQRNYWQIYPYLPKETRGYVPAFIAANYIMNYYCEHNICPMRTRYPIQTDTIMVSRNIDLSRVAELCHLDFDIVKALNPQYKTRIVPGSSALSAIRLPQEVISTFLSLGDELYNMEKEQQELVANSAAMVHGDRYTTPTVSEHSVSTSSTYTSRPAKSQMASKPNTSRHSGAQRGRRPTPVAAAKGRNKTTARVATSRGAATKSSSAKTSRSTAGKKKTSSGTTKSKTRTTKQSSTKTKASATVAKRTSSTKSTMSRTGQKRTKK